MIDDQLCILALYSCYHCLLSLTVSVCSSTQRYVHNVVNSTDSSGDVYDSDGEVINFDSG